MTVVTRFAPSPTGYLHIGGARTALFCWLYARAKGGKFLLRIEDTDKERSTQAAIDAILDGLNWLGLGGDEPPVLQSTRAARHAEVAHELVKRGAAYKCFVTQAQLQERKAHEQRELDALRQLDQVRDRQRHRDAVSPVEPADVERVREIFAGQVVPEGRDIDSVDSFSRWLDAHRGLKVQIVDQLLRPFRSPYRDGAAPPSVDAPFVVRLRMPDSGDLTVTDHVQGPVSRAYADLDELVLLRSDGSPTYMLAVVVDDHDMGVTHVIRGDDHFLNTFRQLPIYIGMDWPQPDYSHVPLIHGQDGKKLSKRHGATAVDEYRDGLGYLPEAMRNYLLRLGWSHGDDEIIPDDKAIAWFDLDGLNKAPARLDFVKLDSVNKHYMALADDQRVFALWSARPEAKALGVDELNRIAAGTGALKGRAANLVQFSEHARFLTNLRPIALEGKAAAQLNDEARTRLSTLLPALEGVQDWSEPAIKAALTQFCEQNSISLGKIGPVLRAVLTGGAPAPDITLVLALLGRNEAFARMSDHARAGG